VQFALSILLGCLLPSPRILPEDVAAALRDLESAEGAARRAAERTLLRRLEAIHEPLLLEAIHGGGLETRRRLSRILGARVDFLPFVFRSAAAEDSRMRETSQEALRFLLRGTALAYRVPVDEYGEGSIPRLFARGPLRVDDRLEPLSRLVEALNRCADPFDPILLDPRLFAGAPGEPRVPDAEFRGDPSSVLQAILAGSALRWAHYQGRFHWITREDPPPEPADAFLILVQSYVEGEPRARRAAATGLGLLAIQPILGVLATDAFSADARSQEALVGLLAAASAEAAVPLSPEALPRILEGLESPDREVRRACGYALSSLGDPRVGSELRRRLPSWEGARKAAALRLLARFPAGEETIALLKRESRDGDPVVAEAAVRALGEVRAPSTAEALEVLSRSGIPRPLAQAAADLLLASRPSFEDLAAALGPPSRRDALLAALPGAGPEGIARFVSEVADCDDPQLLEDLARAASRLEEPRPLASAIRERRTAEIDAQRRLRLEIVSGLAGLESATDEMRASLLSALRKEGPIGLLAARAYGRSGGSKGREELLGLRTSLDALPRERALEGLVEYHLSLPVVNRVEEIRRELTPRPPGLDSLEIAEAVRARREAEAPSLRDLDFLGSLLDRAAP
jgi:HEAT repeat protein